MWRKLGQAMWAVVRAAVPLLKQLTSGKLPEAPAAAAPELCRALSCLCCRTSPCGRTFAGHIFKECALRIHPTFLTSSPCYLIVFSPQLSRLNATRLAPTGFSYLYLYLNYVMKQRDCLHPRMQRLSLSPSLLARGERKPLACTGAAHIAKLLKSDASSVGPVALLSQLLLSELPAPSKARYPPIPPSTSLKISSVFVQLGVVEHLRQRLVYATDALTASSTAGRQLNGAGPSLDGESTHLNPDY